MAAGQDQTKTMWASRLEGQMDLALVRTPVPKPAEGEVLVRVRAVGVCPSGLKLLREPERLPAPFRRIPGVPGHEVAGEVAALGRGVERFQIGDRVVPTFGPTCGHCYYCRRGQFRFCENHSPDQVRSFGFSEYMVCPAISLLPTPEELSDEQASFAEPLGCCIASLDKCELAAGDEAVVFGAGTMGLLHVQLIQALGGRAIVVEVDARRLAYARQIGAWAGLRAEEATPARIQAVTSGRGAAAAVVAVGSGPAIRQALDLVRPGGTVLLFAGTWPPTEITLDPNRIHYQQLVVTGSVGALMQDFERALALLAARVVEVDALVTARFPLAEVMEAHRVHASGIGYKVMVLP